MGAVPSADRVHRGSSLSKSEKNSRINPQTDEFQLNSYETGGGEYLTVGEDDDVDVDGALAEFSFDESNIALRGNDLLLGDHVGSGYYEAE